MTTVIETLWEIRTVTSRFPTGEVKKTKDSGERRWMTHDESDEFNADHDDMIACVLSNAEVTGMNLEEHMRTRR